ncbi:MAG: methionyl-tRNA formyltransferase [Alphaproteobacteria bacterium]|nr:methionyl-tRNA formyltransferase [Alphaproteobacteria bacterium]
MSKKVVFMGTSLFAVPILKSLYQNGYTISVVYTKRTQKSGKVQKTYKSPIQNISENLNIECRTPDFLTDNNSEYDYLKKLNADIAIVVAYGLIIPKKFLNLTKKGFINIHGSILPNWRGAAPIQRCIMNLDKETGISIMKIVEKLDAGPVCSTYKINLNQNENAQDISDKLSHLAADKISKNVNDILLDNIKFVEQDHSKATYASKIEKSEGKINWNEMAISILGKINGLFPTPGAFFIFRGERYKVLKAEISNIRGNVGEVVSDELDVACGYGQSIKILEIQRQGKNPQKISQFMLGSKIKRGSFILNV